MSPWMKKGARISLRVFGPDPMRSVVEIKSDSRALNGSDPIMVFAVASVAKLASMRLKLSSPMDR
jgi:hypothetical protein